MKIKINNIKFLFIYRLPIFKLFIFETDNKNLIEVIKALNIKNRRKKIEYVYDEAIKVINNYYSKDLCQFIDDKCIAQRKNNSKSKNGCCRTCPYLGNKGCISANLPCKLLYCKTALNNFKSLKLKEITIIKVLPLYMRLILKTDYYSTKEDIIDDLYYGIIIYGFRSLKREIKRYIKIKKS